MPSSSGKRLKVVHVTPYYAPAYVYGGPSRSIPLLCRGLVNAGADVTVMTTIANGAAGLDVPLQQPVELEGAHVYYFPYRQPFSRFTSPELAAALQTSIPENDIVHISGVWTQPSDAAATISRGKKPYLISPRGMLMPQSFGQKAWKKWPWFYLIELRNLRLASAIHCASTVEKDALRRFRLDKRAFILPNAIDTGEFAQLPARNTFRARFGIPGEAKVMLFLGRVHQQKGIDLTLSAFQALAAEYQHLHLVIAGPDEGGLLEGIQKWALEIGLAGRVHLSGELKGPARLEALVDADLFVLLSLSESFGMSVAEAMACGLPVVISEDVGIGGKVSKQGAGLVVSRNLAAVVPAIRRILDNDQLAGEMSAAGKRLIASEFSMDAIGRRMLEVYHSIVVRFADRGNQG